MRSQRSFRATFPCILATSRSALCRFASTHSCSRRAHFIALSRSNMLSVVASVNFGFAVQGLHTAGGARGVASHVAPMAPLAIIRMSEAVDDVEQVYKDADAVFACIDADGNGAITQEELVSHLTSSGYKAEAVEKIFLKLDTNKVCDCRAPLMNALREGRRLSSGRP